MLKKVFLYGIDVNFIYAKEEISTLQNVNFQRKVSFKFKNFSGTLLPVSRSKCITEINGKEHELSFHLHFIHEWFASLCKSP